MPKKSKAQLEEERLEREEQERKAKLAEEKRLAEEAEQKRLEDIRIREERKAFREAELQRLHEEQIKSKEDRADRNARLVYEERLEAEQHEWEAFRNPMDDYESMGEREMNTFLSLTEENEACELKEVFDLTQVIQNVGQCVEYKWSDSLMHQNLAGQISSEKNALRCLSQIVQKVDCATARLLRFADSQLNDRSELHLEQYSESVSIGLWGSFADIRPIRKSVIFEKQGVQIDVPKQILQHDSGFVFRVMRIALEPFTLSSYRSSGSSTTGEKYVVGDLLTIDILRPPPQAFNLRAKKWVMRDKSAASLAVQKCAYPSSVNCKVLFRVPDDVAMSDDITVMCWDDENKTWVDDGITDFQYSESNCMAQFYTTVVGTFALVKDRAADFPYKKWSLSPLRNIPNSSNPNCIEDNYERIARFAVQTPKNEVVIDIIGTKVKLVKPNAKYLSDLIGVEMAAGTLLRKLLRRGINLLPIIPPESQLKKDSVLEEAVLQHIARCACSLDFEGSSAWNDSIGRYQIGVHARESTVYAGGLDTFNMDSILAEIDDESISHKHSPDVGHIDSPGVKFSLVMGNEYGSKQKYSHDMRPDEVSHIDLMTTMLSRVMPETIDRLNRENVKFEKAVFNFLRLVRPFSFS